MTIQFAPRHGRAPAQSAESRTWCAGLFKLETILGSSAYGRGSKSLHQLDDRTLADIGITRCGIEYAVRHGRPHA